MSDKQLKICLAIIKERMDYGDIVDHLKEMGVEIDREGCTWEKCVKQALMHSEEAYSFALDQCIFDNIATFILMLFEGEKK